MINKVLKTPLVAHLSKWIAPDAIEIPAKFVIVYLLMDTLDKSTFGVLSIAMLIFSYHSLAQFGVVDWLVYELPKKYSRSEDMNALVQGSASFSFINQALISVLLILLIILSNSDSLLIFACAVYLLQSLFYSIYLHQSLILRYQYKFNFVLNLRIVFSVTRFFLELMSLVFFDIYVFLLVEAFIFLIPIIFLKLSNNSQIKFSLTKEKYIDFFKKGFPFFIVVCLAIALASIDRWVVIFTNGTAVFATYSVAHVIISAALIIPGKLLSIFTQYLREIFTHRSCLASNISCNMSVNSLLIGFLVLILIIVQIGLEFMIFNYIPKYIDVILIISPLLLMAILLFSGSLIKNTLYLLEKRKTVYKIQLASLLLYIVFLFYADGGIIEIIWAMNYMLIFQFSVSTLTVVFNNKKLDFDIEIVRYLSITAISVSYFIFSQLYGDYNIVLLHAMVFVLLYIYRNKVMVVNIRYLSTREFDIG